MWWYIKSFSTKSVVDAVNIVSGGSGYSYKKREVGSAGVSTALNKIEFVSHGYESGEIINYSSTGTVIGGLNSGTDYYLTKVDNNNFKLSAVGLGSTNKDFYYSVVIVRCGCENGEKYYKSMPVAKTPKFILDFSKEIDDYPNASASDLVIKLNKNK